MKLPVPASADVPPPGLALLAEWPRAAWGLARLARDWRGLQDAPRGDGRPVMVLPGLFNSDRSNVVMRRYLDGLGYRTLGWGLGRNLGARTIGGDGARLMDRIAEVYAEMGAPVTLIGVSLGGIMARIAAHRHPDKVRQVITVSSPFAGPPTATNVWRPFEWLSGERITDAAVAERLAEAAVPLPVPSAAIWSRSDGLVNGLICRESEGAASHLNGQQPNANAALPAQAGIHSADPLDEKTQTEHRMDPDFRQDDNRLPVRRFPCRAVEVRSSHLFVQMKPEVLRAIAQLLADQRGSDAR